MMRRSRPAISCQELVELVTAYLDGALSRADRARFGRHIAGCDGCTTYLEQFRATIAATGALREDDLTPAARDELLVAFREWSSSGR